MAQQSRAAKAAGKASIIINAMPFAPTFDEWVRYCFSQAYTDWSGCATDDEDAQDERERHFLRIDDGLLIEYLTRLFESPGSIADQYTDDQIADAVWFSSVAPAGTWGA